MKAEVSIVDVTPKMASDWVENIFDGQRKVRDTHVARLATEIIEGRWKLTSDAIAIIKGKLGNGQHRCWAIVMAGKTVPCLVLRSDDEKLFDIIDSGIARTAADVLNQYDFQYAQVIAASAKIVLMYQKNLFTRLGSTTMVKGKNNELVTVVTRGEILDYSRDNQDSLVEHARIICPLYEKKAIMQKSYTIAFLQIACKKNKSKAIEFVNSVFLGGEQNAAFDLRERLIKNRLSKAKLPASYLFGLTIKAYKSFLAGERPGVLKMTEGEVFPRI